MRFRALLMIFLLFLILFPSSRLTAVQESETLPKLFVRALIYPTYNLSRYDYNNDIDLVELRSYIEIREESQTGRVISDARIKIDGEDLDFEEDHYEKRLRVSVESLSDNFRLLIQTRDGRTIEETYTIPDWLILRAPRPSIVSGSGDLAVAWEFKYCGSRVNVRVYDFKTGDEIIRKDNLFSKDLMVPAAKLPESGIVRIYVICSWFYKQYLAGDHFVRGSEINIMPWSQVFVRIQKQDGDISQ